MYSFYYPYFLLFSFVNRWNIFKLIKKEIFLFIGNRNVYSLISDSVSLVICEIRHKVADMVFIYDHINCNMY